MSAPGVNVYCGRPFGLTFTYDGQRVELKYGLNRNVPVVPMILWLHSHSRYAVVRNGTIKTLPPDAAEGAA